MEPDAASFVIVNEPGVHTTWLLTITDHGAKSAPTKHVVDSLLEVEQSIQDTLQVRADLVARTVGTLGRRDIHLRNGSTVVFEWQPIVVDWRCHDCQSDTDVIDEYYMVHESLWTEVDASADGHLCIGCLESRLGRELTGADFTDAAVNYSNTLARSERLLDRLGRRS